MSRAVPTISAAEARTLLLDAQGLLADPARRCGPAAVRGLIERMGFVQIDSINMVERAHHLTLGSRLDDYRPPMLAKLLERDRRLFEHWTHDASAIPTDWFHHWKPRFARHRERVNQNAWWRERMGKDAKKIIAHVKRRIECEGPLQSRDFEHAEKRDGNGGWWGWKPQKAALEYLWRTGELAIARRVNFQKVYDLTERVFPDAHAAPAPNREEHVDWACRTALDRLGAATLSEITAFWNAVEPVEVRAWCARMAKAGEIEAVLVRAVDGSGADAKPRAAFAVWDWRERVRRAPSPPARLRLLSPFDPVLRDRKRAMRLFNFDYRFEAFVPEPQRKYGYYVLPILEGDRLVGRADAKFHRSRPRKFIGGAGDSGGAGGGELALRVVWWERDVKLTRARRTMLDDAAGRLAAQIGAERWSIPAGFQI